MKMINGIVAIAVLMACTVMAEENKNCPSIMEVRATLAETGSEQHWFEGIKIYKVGSVVYEGKYYHVFNGYVKDREMDIEENRALIFNNQGEYLGYYPSTEQASEVTPAGIYFDYTPMSDNIVEFVKGGLPSTSNLNGVYVKFVPAPKKEAE